MYHRDSNSRWVGMLMAEGRKVPEAIAMDAAGSYKARDGRWIPCGQEDPSPVPPSKKVPSGKGAAAPIRRSDKV